MSIFFSEKVVQSDNPTKEQIENLTKCLEKAILREDYELACKIRDDIKEMTKLWYTFNVLMVK